MSAYVHDCITLNADMYSCVIESSMYGEDGDLARVRFANRNNGVLFLSKHIDDGSSCSKEKLTLSTKMKFLNMSQYTTMVTDKDMEVEYMNYRPQDLVRVVHVGKGLFKNEKTGDSKNDISKRIIK